VPRPTLTQSEDRFFRFVNDGFDRLFLVISQFGKVIGGTQHFPADRVSGNDSGVSFSVKSSGRLVDQRKEIGLTPHLGEAVVFFKIAGDGENVNL